MKYILLISTILLHIPIFAQLSRKSEIKKMTEKVHSVKEFKQIADSLQMSVDELCDYPIIFPIKKPIYISSGFGMRYHPIYNKRIFHTGIDIPKAKGTPVYATGNGIVIRKGYCSEYGNFIEIKHSGNFHSFYAHMSKTLINIGDSVTITDQIACVGSTGIVTGSHLHYEVRKGKRFLNPLGWCYLLFEMKIQAKNTNTINETSYIYENSTDYELHRE